MCFFCQSKFYSVIVCEKKAHFSVKSILKVKIIEISLKVGIVDTVFITDVCTLKFKYF